MDRVRLIQLKSFNMVDLGYGASPVTTVELLARLRTIRPDVRVLGLELDPERVALAASAAEPPWLEFRRGGFELAGARPVLLRAFNVLRQYEEPAALAAWRTMLDRLAPVSTTVLAPLWMPAIQNAGRAAASGRSTCSQ